jgi:hypothetical protein
MTSIQGHRQQAVRHILHCDCKLSDIAAASPLSLHVAVNGVDGSAACEEIPTAIQAAQAAEYT